MAVKRSGFGTFSEGREAKLYELSNEAGACARFTDLGAAWVGMELPAGGGKTVDVILGYDDPAIYERNPGCLGGIVGRHANRIAGACFELDGKHYQLEKNQGENSLHSGPDGWWKRLFRAEVLEDENAVRFSIEEPDGSQGFPGALSFSVTYRLTADSAVEIHYAANLSGAKHTVFNPTNHAYFNLAGHDAGDIGAQEVWIDADCFTPTDAVSIPTGEVRAVAGTAFDFTRQKPIGRDIDAADEQLILGHGYDHNFALNGYDGSLRLAARASDPASGRTLSVYTDRPGLQFYTANWLGDGTPIGKGGAVYQRRGGYCFETQCFPDALHNPDWVQPVIGEGETFRTTSIYRFGGFFEDGGSKLKRLFIAEKPSVALEFARVLGVSGRRQDGYLESGDSIVTWCVGHLITMSYPEVYDERYKKWSLDTLPFLPEPFRYEVIPEVKKQFEVVKRLLTRADVDTIYICTDSGREGEYIYRLVDQMAGVPAEKIRKRVWIDSQTEDEIRRGVAEAKDWSAYQNLSAAAYLRAKEDYLMGINFSRVLTLRYGSALASLLKQRYIVVSVGRVMTCVLGMVVKREMEIRAFQKTVFYRIFAKFEVAGQHFFGEWRAEKGSAYEGFPGLYKNNGFLKHEDAEEFLRKLSAALPGTAELLKNEKKKEVKRPPLLYNLAELQNDCARRFKISPDQTLKVAQELYEKKLITYPRTDARVLSSAVAKEIQKNLSGLTRVQAVGGFAQEVLTNGSYKGIAKSRYTDDKQITDHYALIPTGQGLGALPGLSPLSAQIYEMIARRFLAVFYPPAVYEKRSLELLFGKEHFFAGVRSLVEEGWLKVSGEKKQKEKEEKEKEEEGEAENSGSKALAEALAACKKGERITAEHFELREGETSPPKRYTSGSMILAMENAGQLIEDEELRSQIKGSGIGTSATRAEILKKLVGNRYLALNGKTQIITPTQLGELIAVTVNLSMQPLLRPELTASWEKGLTMVQQGEITEEAYMEKLRDFVARRTEQAAAQSASYRLREAFEASKPYYPAEKPRAPRRKGGSK